MNGLNNKKDGVMTLPLSATALPQTHAPDARIAHLSVVLQCAAGAWRKWLHSLLPTPTLGNPLHEAWSADGEPLERMTPGALAKSSPTHHLILPMNRGQ